MKKVTRLSLALALAATLLLAACGGSASSAPNYVTDDEMLLNLWMVFTQNSNNPDTVLIPETEPGVREVQLSSSLYANLGTLLLERESHRAEDPAQYADIPAEIVISGGDPPCLAELAQLPHSEEQPGGAMIMRLSLVGQEATFVYASAVYTEAHALLLAELVEVDAPPASAAGTSGVHSGDASTPESGDPVSLPEGESAPVLVLSEAPVPH